MVFPYVGDLHVVPSAEDINKKELMNAVKVIDWRWNIETLVEHAGMALGKSKPIWSLIW